MTSTGEHHTLQEFGASADAKRTCLSGPGRTIQKDRRATPSEIRRTGICARPACPRLGTGAITRTSADGIGGPVGPFLTRKGYLLLSSFNL
jgi:hypothetical protein